MRFTNPFLIMILANCYRLDLTGSPLAWAPIPSLGQAIRRHAMTSYDGYVFTIGGMTNNINRFNTATDSWDVPTTTTDQIQQ